MIRSQAFGADQCMACTMHWLHGWNSVHRGMICVTSRSWPLLLRNHGDCRTVDSHGRTRELTRDGSLAMYPIGGQSNRKGQGDRAGVLAAATAATAATAAARHGKTPPENKHQHLIPGPMR